MKEEFVLNFIKDSLIPIDIVSEVTGLNYDEIRSFAEILEVNV